MKEIQNLLTASILFILPICHLPSLHFTEIMFSYISWPIDRGTSGNEILQLIFKLELYSAYFNTFFYLEIFLIRLLS